MRFAAVLVATLLLSGCAWVRQEFSPPTQSSPPSQPMPVPKPEPEPVKPVSKPRPRVERPATPAAPQPPQAEPQTEPPVDYEARCRAMATNRADDAKQLGASPADQTKMQSDTYRECMAQSVK